LAKEHSVDPSVIKSGASRKKRKSEDGKGKGKKKAAKVEAEEGGDY